MFSDVVHLLRDLDNYLKIGYDTTDNYSALGSCNTDTNVFFYNVETTIIPFINEEKYV